MWEPPRPVTGIALPFFTLVYHSCFKVVATICGVTDKKTNNIPGEEHVLAVLCGMSNGFDRVRYQR
jgi:hypothetical protein